MAVQVLAGEELANRLNQGVADSVESWEGDVVWVKPSSIDRVARFLRDDTESDFQFLNSISAVDYVEYFEVVYHLTSFRRQHTAVVKSRVYGRESLSVPSVYDVWRGADFQEREVWDLMGIHFD
ncbi:MAG: NADH-quinone oxidoreductase subunit C, partial [Chloroflexi bacterium]|nr:NADH-quinone oxidoreductase subunit C [Chloroflexota bacterium]